HCRSAPPRTLIGDLMNFRLAACAALFALAAPVAAPAAAPLDAQIDTLADREFETAKYVAKRLKKLGLDVRTGVAKTGVVAVLKGGKPGPVVALRADMDALPVAEQTGVPFASKA